jgi:aromatic-L-amino-acid decarboxylase
MSEEECNARNEAIMHAVNAGGDVFLSHTKLDGRFTLRFAVGNIRTEERHVRMAWERLLSSSSASAASGGSAFVKRS